MFFWYMIILTIFSSVSCRHNSSKNQSESQQEVPPTIVESKEAEESWVALSSGWACSIYAHNGDLWVRTLHNNRAEFDFRIGAGGAIAQLRDIQDNFRNLLSPSYKGEATDRVIQWTWWSETLREALPDLRTFEQRYNLTQAGTQDNLLAPMVAVEVNHKNCLVEVYTLPQDQWHPKLRTIFKSRVSALTRYRVVGEGDLSLERFMLVDYVQHKGQNRHFEQLYSEAWTPLHSPTFTGVAYEFKEQGKPLKMDTIPNFRNYPQIPAAKTRGYAVAVNSSSPASSVSIGVVFGTKNACKMTNKQCQEIPNSHHLNQMKWDTGIGILPAHTVHDVHPGTMLSQHIIITPRRSLNALTVQGFKQTVSNVKQAVVVAKDQEPPPLLSVVRERLQKNLSFKASRTQKLGDLVKGL